MLCTNGAPNLCTMAKMNALEMTQPSRTIKAPTHGPYSMPAAICTTSPGMKATTICRNCTPNRIRKPTGPAFAHLVDDAVHAARLEQLVHVGPNENAHQHHDEEKGYQPRKLEDVALFELAAANAHFLVCLLVRLLLHGLQRPRALPGMPVTRIPLSFRLTVLLALVSVLQNPSSCRLPIPVSRPAALPVCAPRAGIAADSPHAVAH